MRQWNAADQNVGGRDADSCTERQHAPHYLRHLAVRQRAGSVEFQAREGTGWIAARTSDVVDLEGER